MTALVEEPRIRRDSPHVGSPCLGSLPRPSTLRLDTLLWAPSAVGHTGEETPVFQAHPPGQRPRREERTWGRIVSPGAPVPARERRTDAGSGTPTGPCGLGVPRRDPTLGVWVWGEQNPFDLFWGRGPWTTPASKGSLPVCLNRGEPEVFDDAEGPDVHRRCGNYHTFRGDTRPRGPEECRGGGWRLGRREVRTPSLRSPGRANPRSRAGPPALCCKSCDVSQSPIRVSSVAIPSPRVCWCGVCGVVCGVFAMCWCGVWGSVWCVGVVCVG